MMRIFALVASAVGYWYVSSGHCDLWVSWSWQTNLAGLVMFVLCLYLLQENLFCNRPINGTLSIIGAIFTSIYWYVFVWTDEYLYICRGPKAILIGGTTIFLLFVVNTVVDYKGWATTKEEIRKNFEEEIDESFD